MAHTRSFLRVRIRRLALAVLLACPSLARADDSVLLVGAAASLREATEALAKRVEAKAGGRVQTAFGASNTLAAQIRAGAPVDVFLSADERSVDALVREGLVREGDRFVFATNRLVVVAAPDLPFALASPADLAHPALRRLALPDEAVPAGRYAREWLARAGLLEAVVPKILRAEDVRAALAAVETGSADASIVYATDARVAKRARLAFAVPDAEQPRIRYVGAVVAATKSPARARGFVDALRGAPGREALEAAGFGPPAGDGDL